MYCDKEFDEKSALNNMLYVFRIKIIWRLRGNAFPILFQIDMLSSSVNITWNLGSSQNANNSVLEKDNIKDMSIMFSVY
jgi:hypothetical protein